VPEATRDPASRLPLAASLSVAVIGSGGAGVLTAGSLLLEAAGRAGWYGLLTRSVGPQIRGGEAAAILRLGAAPVLTHDDRFRVIVALDWRNAGRFADEIPLAGDVLVIADPDAGEAPPGMLPEQARQVPLPLAALAKEIPGGRANMAALGVLSVLLGVPARALDGVLERALAAKGEAAVAASAAGVRAGAAAAAEAGLGAMLAPAATPGGAGRWILSGNEGAGLGAIRGGVRFVAGYPITPATDLLEWLAPALTRVGGALVQAEDELASLNMLIGGSFGGVPSLTATSGPGLALMIESLGLAVASEVPLVVVNVMRGGPSTGLPTKSEQSDLNIAVYGLHGDAPHLVLAPSSVADCLFTTQWTVYLAEALQTPAIVLSDQFLGQARTIVDRPADVAFIARREVAAGSAVATSAAGTAGGGAEGAVGYRRYALGGAGVSPMALPGTRGGQYCAEGLAHTERGTPSSAAADHGAQMDKRRDKLEGFDYGAHWAEVDAGGADAAARTAAPTAVITWGSTAGAVREGIARARDAGARVRSIVLRLIAPLQRERLAAALSGVERVLVVEQNHSGQLHAYLRAQAALPGEVRTLHRAGPLSIRPEEVRAAITQWEGDARDRARPLPGGEG